jgi:hypothetical protein
MCLGYQLLELGVLSLHPTKLRPPFIKTAVAKALFAAQLLDRHRCLGLLQKSDDLFFSVYCLIYLRILQ